MDVHTELAKGKAAMPQDIAQAHEHSSRHRKEIDASKVCGCFYCLKTFTPDKIVEWLDDGQCAMCPYCAIDSVIGDASGYPITKEFLKKMRHYWFDS